MTWGMVAVAGVTLVGGAMASRGASKDRAIASEADQASLDFEVERYDDWKSIYGDIQQNLSDYYLDLSPDQYEVVGLEALEEEKAKSLTRLNENLAQRGITDSGLAAAAEIGIEMDSASDRADIRRSAPGLVAQEQLSFLQVGLGQDPSQSLSNTLANRASQRRAQASDSSVVAGEAVGTALTTVGTGLSDYLNRGDNNEQR